MPSATTEKKTNPIVKLYLALYNFGSAAAWGFLLYLTAKNYIDGKGPESVYDTIQEPATIIQSMAVLEIVHCLLGLVRSPIFTTVMQVFSRIFIIVMMSFETKARLTGTLSYAYTTLMICWCVTEVIRYSFYGLKLFDACPYILLYLRYTLFYVLYPVGVASELVIATSKLSYIKEHRPYSVDMPNTYNFAFDFYYFAIAVILGYLPGFPQLFGYMLHQRKQIIGGGDKKKQQ